MGFLDAFSASNGKKAAQAGAFYAQQGKAEAGGLLDAARSNLTDNYGKAQGYFAPAQDAINRGMKGYEAYGDATGVNGADGMARARALFTQLPGYQEGLERGLDQLDRRAASRGMLNSGNTMQDTLKYGTDYAQKYFNDYRQGLLPYMTAPAQQIQLSGAQAGLQSGLGDKIAALFERQAGNAMQTGNTMGQAMGNFYNANDVASKNQIGGAIAGINALASLTGASGFGGMGGLLSGLFGGGGASALATPTMTGMGIPTGNIY